MFGAHCQGIMAATVSDRIRKLVCRCTLTTDVQWYADPKIEVQRLLEDAPFNQVGACQAAFSRSIRSNPDRATPFTLLQLKRLSTDLKLQISSTRPVSGHRSRSSQMDYWNSNLKDNGAQPRICVVGAGAIGLTLAARIGNGPFSTSIVARGESLREIAAKGIFLTHERGIDHSLVHAGSAAELGPQDIVLLCPKSQDLPQMARDIQPLLDDHTLIVPVVNGIPWWYFEGNKRSSGRAVLSVDPESVLTGLLPSERVIGSVTMFTATRTSRTQAVAMNGFKLVLGEIDDVLRPRTNGLAEVLNRSGLEARVSEKIRDPMWTKVIANLMSNPLSVVAETHLKDLCGTEPLSSVVRQLRNEALLVAASYGARLELDPEQLLVFAAGMGEFKTSMLQDFQTGNPLEVGAICNAVMELGCLRGIDMPLTRTITAIADYKSEARRRAA